MTMSRVINDVGNEYEFNDKEPIKSQKVPLRI